MLSEYIQMTTAALFAVGRASHFCGLVYRNQLCNSTRFRWSTSEMSLWYNFVPSISV